MSYALNRQQGLCGWEFNLVPLWVDSVISEARVKFLPRYLKTITRAGGVCLLQRMKKITEEEKRT